MGEPTHAGGIVFKAVAGVTKYLVISGKKQPEHWVFPKGHIVPGETPEESAKREVLEETGIIAEVRSPLADIQFQDQSGSIRARFFLMAYIAAAGKGEQRKRRWCTYTEGLRLLTFEDSRALLRTSHALLKGA